MRHRKLGRQLATFRHTLTWTFLATIIFLLLMFILNAGIGKDIRASGDPARAGSVTSCAASREPWCSCAAPVGLSDRAGRAHDCGREVAVWGAPAGPGRRCAVPGV